MGGRGKSGWVGVLMAENKTRGISKCGTVDVSKLKEERAVDLVL